MKKVFLLTLVVLFVFSAASAFAQNNNPCPGDKEYQFNIIGMKNAKNPDMTNNNGHRIFVPLKGNTNIYMTGDTNPGVPGLQCGNTFDVLDADGTDGRATLLVPCDPLTAEDLVANNTLTSDMLELLKSCVSGNLYTWHSVVFQSYGLGQAGPYIDHIADNGVPVEIRCTLADRGKGIFVIVRYVLAGKSGIFSSKFRYERPNRYLVGLTIPHCRHISLQAFGVQLHSRLIDGPAHSDRRSLVATQD